ncbi:hypothetical protein ANCDUO_18534, partial [Ancylostoma duodenale]
NYRLGLIVTNVQVYPCAIVVIDAPRLHIYTRASIVQLAFTGIGAGVLAAAVNLWAILLSFYFLRKNNHLSQKSKIMQKRFLVYLCVQAAVPTLSLLAPVILILWSEVNQMGQGCVCRKQNAIVSASEQNVRSSVS